MEENQNMKRKTESDLDLKMAFLAAESENRQLFFYCLLIKSTILVVKAYGVSVIYKIIHGCL